MSDILKRLASLSPEKRDLLLKQLNAKAARAPQAPAIPPLEPRPGGEAAVPLSFAQQRLWFLEQLEPGTARYNVPMAVRLRGTLETAVLDRVFTELLRRHEPLRTTFRVEADTAVQVIAPTAGFRLPVVDLTVLPAERREDEARRLATEEAQRPFELERGPLLRTTLLKLDAREHVLLLTMHHIVSDGWSMGVLVRELGQLYAAFSRGQPSPLPELPVQYADYALWQRQWLQDKALEKQLTFWKEQLAGASPALELPTDRPRPPEQTFHGAALSWTLPRELSDSLKALGQREGVTPFMLLLAAFQVVLHRYSGQESFCIGTPMAGRDQARLEGLIGFFANTLALRTRLEGNPTFRELLQRVRESTVRAFSHQHLPFEKLVEELQPERDLGRSPLFQVLFSFQNTPTSEPALAGLTLHPIHLETSVSKFELELNVGETPDGLHGSFVYNTDLFDAATISRLAGHLRVLLEGVVAAPESRLSELSLLTAAERRQVLVEWNDTAASFPADACLHHLFEAQVERTPDAPALGFEGTWLTYRELNQRANRLAHALRALGVGPESRVGVRVQRSAEMVVALLAILKAGGAYVPLDPTWPGERLAYMLEDSGARVLVTQAALEGTPSASDTAVVRVDVDSPALASGRDENPSSGAMAGNLAYILYTSGSTGQPKGVQVPHRTVSNFFTAMDARLQVPERGVWLAVTSISFDISVLELLWTLSRGFAVVVQKDTLDTDWLPEAVRQYAITHLQCTPSLARTLVAEPPQAEALRHLKQLLVGGEALSTELARELRRYVPSLLNMYGPTETTVWSSSHDVPARLDGSVPLGTPLANTQLHVLDERMRPVPLGVPGELYIGGEGVVRGYLNRPGLTAERFVPDPFSTGRGARLYRTGDRVRRRADGSLEFLGRIDFQVKVRGFRIELGEVEAALEQHAGVSQAVVVVREDSPGDKRLVAYVVPASAEQPPSVGELRDALKQKLPEYMVPAAFVALKALPLTANGKVDRKALPIPDATLSTGTGYVAPRNEVEQRLCDIWAQVLGLKQVGIHDNFFQLGGDSIISLQVVARARRAGFVLATRQLFQHQTVAQLAQVVTSASAPLAEQGPVTGPVPLTPVQHHLLAHDTAHAHHFNQSVLLASRQPLEPAPLEKALQHLLSHHDALRLRFRQHEGAWLQENAGPEETPFLLLQVDLSATPASEQPAALEAEAARLQASFVLSQPPLLRAALFQLGNGQQRLLLAAHHLVVDAVSWRVLVEDLESAYQQLQQGVAVTLPAKSTSFQSWARRLQAHAHSESLLAEAPLWLDEARQHVAPLPTDTSGPNTHASARSVSVCLDTEETKVLLQEVPSAWRAHINDVLLTALARALGEWTGQSQVLVHLEGHGREDLFGDVDLSRTVGWFTSFTPVLLPVPSGGSTGECLRSVRDSLRRLPHQGLGFGLLRWLGTADVAQRLQALPVPQVAFNYLGQLDAATASSRLFSLATGASGPSAAPAGSRLHALEINGSVLDGQLRLAFGYSAHLHHASTIESLAGRFLHHLRALISLRASEEARRFSPGDFPLAALSQPSLDALLLQTGSDVEDLYPLSPTQQGMLFHALISSSAYYQQYSWTVTSELDLPVFLHAWEICLQRHPILRSSFHWEGLDTPLQAVHTQVELPFELLDWRALPASEQQTRFEQLLFEDKHRGIDLRRAPLVRLTGIRLGDDVVRFLWSYHHLLVDGWSIGLLIREVFSLYEAFRAGLTPQLTPGAPFRDYIAWLQRRGTSADASFWRGYLEGFTAPTSLPADTRATPPQGQQPRYPILRLDLSTEATSALQAFARQHQLTLNTLALAAWALVLSRYSGEQDVLFGNTVAGRPPELPGSDTMVGMFINSLPTRVRVPEERASLLPWLQSLQAQQLELRQYEHSPLTQIQSLAQVPRGTPLFESLVILENLPVDTAQTGRDSSIQAKDVENLEHTNYPLHLSIHPGTALRLRFVYESPRFEAATMQRLLEHYRTALQGLASASRLEELSLLSNAERRRVLEEWSRTPGGLPHQSVLQLIEAHARLTPDAPAVRFGDAQLSYAELNSRSNQLARHLRRLGVGPEVLVSLCLERSLALVVSMLATLKAGGAWLALDPSLPSERLDFISSNALAPVLLTHSSLEHLLDRRGYVFLLDEHWERVERESEDNLHIPVDGDHLAYVIYTSGSTGRPKGTLLTRSGLANTAREAARAHGYRPDSRVLQFASTSFDASVCEVFSTLVAGACLVLANKEQLLPDAALRSLLESQSITAVTLTPSVLAQLEPHGLPKLETLISAGEACSPELARRWSSGRTLLNAYGPTEVTICATISGPVDSQRLSIGRALPNAQVYVLDSRLLPVAVGVPGELYVGGAGVARGYLGQPALTAERFLPHPFSSEPGARLYRTGDKVRWLPHGELEFLGRLDEQVKLRGFRIELGEVESALRELPSVRETVVVLREDAPGDKRLVAYLVPQPGELVEPSSLRSSLLSRLPEYMVPSAFVSLEALPLTTSGKVDRKALPSPSGSGSASSSEYVAPRSDTEKRLASIWSEVLHVDLVGLHDDFMSLGGHSLLATQVISRIRSSFGVELPLRSLFESTTLQALAEQLDAANASQTNQLPPLRPASRQQPLPLSFSQQRLWFLEQLEPGTARYNVPMAVRLQGALDARIFERVFHELIRRHEPLRTTFMAGADNSVQVIASTVAFELPVTDLTVLPVTQREAEAWRLATEEAQRPFDLERGPLLRARLLKLDDQEHVLALNMHHIVSDGWSMGVLVREAGLLYAAYSQNQPSPLPELPVQYADYAVWQRQWLQGEELERQLSYWKQQLAGAAPALELPTDRPRPSEQTFHGALLPVSLPLELSKSLGELCQREGVTPFMLLLSAFQVVLHRYSGQEDFCVGSPIAGRDEAQLEGLIGFFVNTLVLRTRMEGNPTFRELLHRVRETTLGAFAHQHLPFEKLVEELQPERNLGRSPLFQVLFAFQNTPTSELNQPGLALRPFHTSTSVSKFELELALSETPNGLQGSFTYNTDLFDAATISRLSEHLRVLLEGVVASPESRLSELPLLTATERQQVLVEWNQARRELPESPLVHRLFEAQVRRAPDAPALRFGTEELTYGELNARANQLAHHLRQLGVGPEVLVGLCLERSPELVVSILATLKAGGAWLPLDPSLPSERLDFIASDAEPRVLITHSSLMQRVGERAPVLLVDEHWERVERESEEDLDVDVHGGNLAYVIYTSGSTGRPKGTLLQHRGLCNTALQTVDFMDLRPGRRLLQFFSSAFDASVSEVFPALLSGACLVLASRDELMPGAPLLQVVQAQSITTLKLTPSVLAQLRPEDLSGVQTLITAGEACSSDLVARFQPGRRFVNAYGPTECTVCATVNTSVDARRVSIGQPFHNVRAYVLDSRLHPLPVGVPGELYVGGAGLARGYLGRPELTAERFLPNPFASEPGERLYRTGDKVRWLADGTLEYLGRIDFQVKLRGFRIELGEVESALCLHPSVRESVVLLREDSPGLKRLVAYLVPTSPLPSGEGRGEGVTPPGLKPEELRTWLQQKLPEYMVPSSFVVLEALPLNSSGKLDRKALPAPDASRSGSRNAYVAPRNEVEQRLCGIWAQVLGLKQVGIHDNFFELGGDSIISLQVVARARQAGLVLSTRQLFQHQTVARLAPVVKSASAPLVEQGPITGPVPLTPIQQHVLAHDAAHAHHFNQSVLLGTRQPLDPARLETAFAQVVAHHDALRLRFRQHEGAWQQENTSPEEAPFQLLQVDLSATLASEQPKALEAEAARLQASFVLSQPPLLRAALFQLGNGQQRLFVVAHHLVVDAVSWRVLVEDLESAYQQLQHGPRAALPAKTTSFQSWAHRLQAHARSERLLAEVPRWLDEARQHVAPLPTDASGPNTQSSERLVSLSLDAEETKLLLQEVPSAWRAHINDVLLTALAQTVSEWTGQSQVLVNVEGHGREELFEDVDLSRTVGWFTSFTPVLLPVPSGGSTGERLRAVRDSLSRLPHRGIGFGLLEWLGPPDVAQRLQALPAPQVAFNYLGQLDAAAASSRLFTSATEPSGHAMSPAGSRLHVLELNGSVLGGQLRLAFSYSAHLHLASTIESLAGRFLHHLRALITLRTSEDARSFSPGDFPLAALSQPSLDALLRQAGSDVEDLYPLSPTQQGMLFHALLSPESSTYFEQLSWTVTSALDLPAFLRAWKACLQRHTILRSSFLWEGLDSPLQAVNSQVELPFELLDWRELPAAEQRARFEQLLREDKHRGIDLRRAPLVRLTGIRLADDAMRFVWSHHHLLVDGWSLGLLISEVFSLYESFRAGVTPQPAPRAPFRDYIAWLQRRDASADESFWRGYLEGFTAPTPLPADTHATPPQGQQPAHPTLELGLSAEATSALQDFARQHQLTLNTLALASWGLVLSRYSGEQDVVFGNTVAGRPPELPGSDTLVGIFINSLPARVRVPSGSAPLLPWLQSLQAQQLELRQYEHSPLVQVQSFSQVPRGTSLFDSLLVFENYPLDASMSGTVPSLQVSDVQAFEHTNYPLTLSVLPGQTLRLRAVYDSPRFEPASMQRLLEHWRSALLSLASASRLGDVSLLSDAERQQVLVQWNATAADFPATSCIHHLFEQQVALRPDSIAVEFGDARLSYRELDARSNALAHLLRSHGVGPDVLVALCMERSLELIVSLLAILKAGGAYLPLDASYPAQRLSFMLEDAPPLLLLTSRALRSQLPVPSHLPALFVEELSLDGLPTSAPASAVSSRNLAYVDFTSGTTGRPKGVAIEHRSVLRLFHGIHYAHLGPEQTFLLLAPISFDASTLELWGPLLFGGRLVVFPPQSPSDLELLSQVLTRHRVTTLHLTAGLFSQVVEHKPECLRGLHQLLTGGDVVSAPHVRRVLESLGLPVTACYGPTESTLFTSCFRMSRPQQVGSSVPIGSPIANTQVYLLDASFQPVPSGVPGELFIGGEGLARGYLSRPELTAERFLPNPFGTTGSRLYRTGDLARWRNDGVLEFLGRLDNQVKVRGYRIELAEVEAALLAHSSVREAFALVREDVPGDKRLVAYFTSDSQQLDTPALRAFLQQRLPEFMLPSAFVRLAALPLTSNAKVDRKALPAPDGALSTGTEYVAPRSETEQQLAALWSEVLRVERVGLHDNFFELGGHSLLATQVISRLRATFGVELPLRTLFEAPTLEALALAITSASRATQASALPPLRPVERTGALPLSFAQQRLWFLDQLVPDSALYNLPACLRLEGALDTAALERGLTELVRRHEVLRTSFPSESGQPFQRIAPAAPLPLERTDLSALPANEREAQARRLLAEECRKPFSLARGPLLRALLLKLDEQTHVLVLNMHHIVSDGWSMGVLSREVAALYEAFSQGQPSPLPELPVQYADFSAWQRKWLQGETLEAQFAYWRQQLAGAPQLLELPTDKPRPAEQSYRGATLSRAMPAALSRSLEALCQREGVTSFMVLLAAFQTLLSRYSGQTDVVVGTDIAGRTHADTEGLIGFFVNQLVMRGDLSGDPSFRELLRRVKDTTLGAYAHQDVPFEELVRVLNPERSRAHAPLFQVKLVLQNTPTTELHLPGLTLRTEGNDTGAAKFDLTLSINETSEGLFCACDYSTDLYEADTMARLLEHLRVLLEAATANPDARLSALPLLTGTERQQLLVDWNDTRAEFQDTCAHHLIEAQVERTPDVLAVEGGGQSLTYRQLDERANQLAWHLRSLGIGPEVLVGLCLERTPELVVAILAILKAGGAWLPMDPTLPAERLGFMLRDARPPVLITQEHLADELPVQSELLVCLDAEWDAIATHPVRAPGVRVLPENLAYVIYTSGSTGQPKGTLLHHRGLCNTARRTIEAMRLRPGSRVLQFASIGFDASVWEMLPTLMAGGQLHLGSRDELMPGAPLRHVLQQRAITAATLTPSVLAQLEPQGLEALETITSAGEACTSELVARWKPGRRFINAYGPTETTICATLDTEVEARRITIGRPFQNVRAYVLDASLRPVPAGVPGELCIGGVGLARGYLGRPELTAERFIPDPFSAEPGERLYRTGDKVRWLADGHLEYLGRIDFQVKLNGFRIELGEVESVLTSHASVREAVVVLHDGGNDNKRLVAYVVPEEGQSVETGVLRTFAGTRLPAYMVPSAIVMLPALPLTSSGKVDRKALPAPDGALSTGAEYVAPRNETEQQLAALWSEVLRVERVGLRDNFFELGGHSLLATQVISRLRATFGVELPLRILFEATTLEALALAIGSAARVTQVPALPPLRPVDRTGALPLSFAQQRLWFLDQILPDSAVYNMPAPLRLEGTLDTAALERGLTELVRRHEVLRTSFHVLESGEPFQHIAPPTPLRLERADLSALPAHAREAEAHRLLSEECRKPFSLARGPLLRALLLKLDEQEHVLLLNMHHIISDGWSMGVLSREVAALYEAFSQGKPSPLPELPVQYADFSAWQRQWLQGETLETQLSYWRQQLAGAPQLLELPTDKPRPAVQSYRGGTLSRSMPAALSRSLEALCQREGTTSFMALLAAFQTLLSRYSGQTDVMVGTDIAGRTHADTEGLIGFFVNQLVMRGDLSGDPTFRELLGRTRQVALGAYAHQDIPFEELVRVTNPERSLAHAPIFQVKLVLQNTPATELRVAGLTFKGAENDAGAARFDLTLFINETPAGLSCTCNYSTDLYEAGTIARMFDHLQVLLESASANPDTRLSALPLLTDTERQQVLVDWNDTATDFPSDATVHQLFEAQARLTPDALAVHLGAQRLSFRQLDERSNQLAWHLLSLGVGPDVRVGLCLERSPDMVVGLLAILKAGGAYVPLDPSYPSERLAFLLSDSLTPLLVTQAHLADELPVQSQLLVLVDSEWDSLIAHQPTHSPKVPVAPGNLAYVIYTSGSTGRPKGAMLEHRGVVNYLHWCTQAYSIAQGNGSPVHSSLSFDLTVTSLLAPLTVGRPVLLVPESQGVQGLGQALLSGDNFSLVKLTPSHLRLLEQQLPADNASGLTRSFIIGGEALTSDMLAFWRQHAPSTTLVNEYGPTETVVGCCVHTVQPHEASTGSVSIGRPIANTRLYVLDAHLRPVPTGIPGELFIGGAQVGRGYLGRPELTAERFLPDSFSSTPGARLYRTGDKARWLPDGSLEYLGRLDFQVKLRGFRIELGEIESALELHSEVRQSLVLVREDSPGDKRLVAYVVPHSGAQPPSSTTLRDFLQSKLPEYMVPQAFVSLDTLPLTSNGKVDRAALPAPDLSRSALETTYVAPRNDVEQRLCDVWAQVLRLPQVGIHDNFFDLGGDSLLCVKLVARAAEVGLAMQVNQMFQHQTVSELARVVGTTAPPTVAAEDLGAPRAEEQLPLLPHHRWLVETFDMETQIWASTMVWDVPPETRVELLRASVAFLGEQRDVFRLRLRRTPEGWTARMLASADEPHVEELDLAGLTPQAQREAMLTTGRRLQSHLSITREPVLALVLCRLGGSGPDKLILSLHHCMYDGYAMPMVLEDLHTTYLRLATGQPPQPLAASSTYRQYMRTVAEHGRSAERMTQARGFWLDEARLHPVTPMPVDQEGGQHTDLNSRRLSMPIPPELVGRLTDYVRAHEDVYLNDLLLFGLARAWARWTGGQPLRLDVEHNGRADLVPGVDLSRTLGPTTLKYPMLFEAKASEAPRAAFSSLKRTMRETTAQALNYGLLRYGEDEAVRQRLAACGSPQVFFNNQGATLVQPKQTARIPAGVEYFAFPREDGLPSIVSYDLMIECNGTGEAMQVTWVYSGDIQREETIRSLATDFYAQIAALLDES
ncbi:non-ribosomal peptide synthase/polyketide synthase [Archangium gephyra]|uniref:non-ribosomal peptide synthase/polyketide synthase n=1 Tax=Archangium gephyra TaxID=48 RepID=UPI0035D453D0